MRDGLSERPATDDLLSRQSLLVDLRCALFWLVRRGSA
jgi:hypothetical protein